MCEEDFAAFKEIVQIDDFECSCVREYEGYLDTVLDSIINENDSDNIQNPMTEYKESFMKRLFEKLKNFFKNK